LDLDEARKAIREISEDFGLQVDPDAIVETLPVGIQQKVEIIKALIYEAKVLILDEPTAVLTPQETDELLETMRDLKSKGTSIIFITHKLREVRAVADQITIIRRGKVVAAVSPQTSEGELASMMVGRAVDLAPEKYPHEMGGAILELKNLTVRDQLGTAIVKGVNFHVNAGEVLAVAGVQGNGQSELARALINLEEHIEGSILLDGKEIRGASIKDSLHAGIAFIPESRELDGVIGSFSIAENLILDLHEQAPYSKGINVMQEEAEKRVAEFDIRTQSIMDSVSTLSGGNKQKVVIARELSRPIKVLVASQPTRGLDVGSIEFVHERILSERDAGRGVLLFSTELDEVIALADRIAVMYRGEILDIVDSKVTREELGLLMAGITSTKASA
jgi:simple sugar transport system ATP-binding protein